MGLSRTSNPATSAVPSGRHEAGKHPHGGRFSGSVRTQETDDLAFFHFKRQMVNGDVPGISLGKPLDFDHKSYSKRKGRGACRKSQ